MTEQEKAALMNFVGTTYGQAKTVDNMITSTSGQLQRTASAAIGQQMANVMALPTEPAQGQAPAAMQQQQAPIQQQQMTQQTLGQIPQNLSIPQTTPEQAALELAEYERSQAMGVVPGQVPQQYTSFPEVPSPQMEMHFQPEPVANEPSEVIIILDRVATALERIANVVEVTRLNVPVTKETTPTDEHNEET
tara:strand:- start:502 stop:1077 length:576 start_codon:yes stop_codon:yes gene_type:complete